MKIIYIAAMIIILLCLDSYAQETVEVIGYDLNALEAHIVELSAKNTALDETAKGELATAYLARANVFYVAGQPRLYKYSLGDFRRVLRLQPGNEDAKQKAEQIVSIYESLGKAVPENGNEPDFSNLPRFRFVTKPDGLSFPQGQTSLRRDETIPAHTAYLYQITLQRGTHFKISIKAQPGVAYFSLARAGDSQTAPLAVKRESWQGVIPETGDYLIKMSSAATGYACRLAVEVSGTSSTNKSRKATRRK